MQNFTKHLALLALLLTAATGAQAQSTYTVTVKDGTEDADKWTINPSSAAKDATVTIKYNGTKKVKSIKAVKVSAALLNLTVSASGNPAIYYVSGETWAQAIANHATENSGWGVDIGRTVWYEMEGRDLGGAHGARVTADDVIDSTKYYELAW